jgi:peptidoglycan hydrolase-like protein with peptidoglycan-binding domain
MHKHIARWAVGASVALSLLSFTNFAQASSLTGPQIQAIIGLLQSFGADQNTITNVSVALGGAVTDGPMKEFCLRISQTLALGSSGKEVSDLQNALINAQYLSVPPSGYFGPLTQKAVMNWQSAHGISPIGVVGPQTRAKMACVPTPIGENLQPMTATPASGIAPLTVDFTSSYVLPQNLQDTAININFGDGTSQNITCDTESGGTCQNPRTIEHTYNLPGTYNARLSKQQMCALSDCTTTLGTNTITVTSTSSSPLSITVPTQGSVLPITKSTIVSWHIPTDLYNSVPSDFNLYIFLGYQMQGDTTTVHSGGIEDGILMKSAQGSVVWNIPLDAKYTLVPGTYHISAYLQPTPKDPSRMCAVTVGKDCSPSESDKAVMTKFVNIKTETGWFTINN